MSRVNVSDLVPVALGILGTLALVLGFWENRRAWRLTQAHDTFEFNLSSTLQTIRWAVDRADMLSAMPDHPDAIRAVAFAEGMRNCAAQLGVPPQRIPSLATMVRTRAEAAAMGRID